MNKEQLLQRIEALLVLCNDKKLEFDPERLAAGALTIMAPVYGENSLQIRLFLARRDNIARLHAGNDSGRVFYMQQAVKGALENFREEIEAGLLTSLERRITSDVLSDLIQPARAALKEAGDNAKNIAAVLAAAAYEDTLRRLARQHAGVIGKQ